MATIEDFTDNSAKDLLAINDYIGYQIDALRKQWDELNRLQCALMQRYYELEPDTDEEQS